MYDSDGRGVFGSSSEVIGAFARRDAGGGTPRRELPNMICQMTAQHVRDELAGRVKWVARRLVRIHCREQRRVGLDNGDAQIRIDRVEFLAEHRDRRIGRWVDRRLGSRSKQRTPFTRTDRLAAAQVPAEIGGRGKMAHEPPHRCLLYTSDAADERSSV